MPVEGDSRDKQELGYVVVFKGKPEEVFCFEVLSNFDYFGCLLK